MIDVKDFGALGNGSTDDTAAIQSAINSLGTSGGTVYFPVGDYSITSALTVSSDIELLGESLEARILADTADAAIKVASNLIYNEGISIRRLEIRGGNTTPIGVDARYMSLSVIDNCEITQFPQCCIYYGGNTTDGVNASWSNIVIDSVIRNSAKCIYLNGVHSTGGSPANWITIEHCTITPYDTVDSNGIDLANGDTARVLNNDIGYAPNATAVVLRAHRLAEFDNNRFEDIGDVAPSHQIEKEFGFSTFQISGTSAVIYYQRAEHLAITGAPTGGTFTLTRGVSTTGNITFSTNPTTLANNIRTALQGLAGIGAGNVDVVNLSATEMRIAWLNGRGLSNRPNLTANAGGLTGGTTPGISVLQGTQADAIRYSFDIATGGVTNDTDMPSVNNLGQHLDIGLPLVMRQPIVSVLPPGGDGFQLQRYNEDYPRLKLMTNGNIQWNNPETGLLVGGLNLHSYDPSDPKLGWDDNFNVALSRRTNVFNDAPAGDYYRGVLHRNEGGTGVRDQLRFGMKDKDDQTYFRHLYPGFTASQSLDFPSISAGAVAFLTITATGAQVGDAVIVTPPSNLAAGLIGFGFVSSANTVTVRLLNGSGATVNPAAATWSALILQP